MHAISKKLLYAVMKYDRYDGVDLNMYLTSQNFRNTLYTYMFNEGRYYYYYYLSLIFVNKL